MVLYRQCAYSCKPLEQGCTSTMLDMLGTPDPTSKIH
jgi:hypothetical protein